MLLVLISFLLCFSTFPFSCSSMGPGLFKAGHDRYTYSCIVMRQAKVERPEKDFVKNEFQKP